MFKSEFPHRISYTPISQNIKTITIKTIWVLGSPCARGTALTPRGLIRDVLWSLAP